MTHQDATVFCQCCSFRKMRKTQEIKLKHSFYFHGFLPYIMKCMNMNLIMTEDWCPHWFPNVAAFLAATHLDIISCRSLPLFIGTRSPFCRSKFSTKYIIFSEFQLNSKCMLVTTSDLTVYTYLYLLCNI